MWCALMSTSVHPVRSLFHYMKMYKSGCVSRTKFLMNFNNAFFGFSVCWLSTRGSCFLEDNVSQVTNVALHQSDVFQNDLLLSSSFDWSVNLYSTRYFQSPVLSLQHYEDYVCDVKWHPSHPAVFTTIDASGLIEVSTESSFNCVFMLVHFFPVCHY